MLQIAGLPAVKATLNGIAAVFLLLGYVPIRRGAWQIHKRCMLSAMLASMLFLISYVTYHLHTGSKPFPGFGIIRVVYFLILVTHIALAATILPLALVTTARGLRSQFDRHV